MSELSLNRRLLAPVYVQLNLYWEVSTWAENRSIYFSLWYVKLQHFKKSLQPLTSLIEPNCVICLSIRTFLDRTTTMDISVKACLCTILDLVILNYVHQFKSVPLHCYTCFFIDEMLIAFVLKTFSLKQNQSHSRSLDLHSCTSTQFINEGLPE